jgi:hypothetical protein
VVSAGSSTGKVTVRRGSPCAAGARRQVERRWFRRVVPHRQRGLAVEQLRGAREQQLQVVVQLGHRADRRARGAHRVGLVDGDGRRHAVHAVHRRAVHAVEELPRVGEKVST